MTDRAPVRPDQAPTLPVAPPEPAASTQAQAQHAVRVSAARALIEVRARTGRAVPADVLALAREA